MRKYPAYKPSGYSWFSDVPSHWEIKDLKYELTFQTGGTPSTKERKYYDGDNIWITIGDMDGKVVSESSQRITKEAVDVANISRTPQGSLLYSFKLSVGQVAFAGNDCYTNEAIASFLPSIKYDINYWYYALPFTLIHNANENIYGAKLLNQELIKNAVMIVPSKEEQQSIVRFLDYKTGQIDNFIANRQKQIELLKEQKTGIINESVTKGINLDAKMKPSGFEWIGEIPEHWQLMELKFAAKMMRGKFSHRPRNDERLYGGEYPFIQTGDVTKTDKYITTYNQTLNEWGYSVSKKFPKGTVVITIAANIGDIAILNFDACFPDSVVGFFSKNNLTEYLFYLLKSMKEVFLSESIEGTQLNLSVDRLSSIKIAIPKPTEQKQILEHIKEESDTIDTLISKYQKQIDLMQEYRTSLISQTVTGKIDVRDWQPKKEKEWGA